MPKTKELTEPTTAPTSNGHPRLPRHHEWIDVPEYPGLRAKIWSNAPRRVFLDLDSGDVARIRLAVTDLIAEVETVSDGVTYPTWYDCDGVALPGPSEPTFIDDVPTELLACVLVGIRNRVNVLPLSLRTRRDNSASG